MFKKYICIDFDGVIHSYKSGWKGIDVIPDEPVKYAIEWLNTLIASSEFQPCIYSSRSFKEEGIEAMKKYLIKHGVIDISKLDFPTQKPPAFLTIDDRAICFKGEFPSLSEISNFKTWYKG